MASPIVFVRGWCFDESGRPVRGVRVRAGFRAVEGRYGAHRPDVRRHFAGPPASEWSGFGVALRLPPGRRRLRLEAKLDGRWVPFHDLTVSVPWSAPGGHALRMARFWAEAALGRPESLARLSPEQQELLCFRLERNGGPPLRTAPHHPPRALAPERFPPARLGPERLPLIAVVTPSLQQGDFIEAAMRSVLDQPGVRIDYVVQDGGSTDRTLEILRRYAPRLKSWASGPDGGLGDALRRGFAATEGGPDDLMAYLNSDDLFMPGAVRFVAEYFARHPEVDAVYGHRVLIDEEGREVGRWWTPRPPCLGLRWFDLVPQETLFWRRRIWERAGGVDPDFRYSPDWDLLLRFAEAGARLRRLPRFLGLFRLHPRQKTAVEAGGRGLAEMARLRRRNFGGDPPPEEMAARLSRAQVESALLARLGRWGLRL